MRRCEMLLINLFIRVSWTLPNVGRRAMSSQDENAYLFFLFRNINKPSKKSLCSPTAVVHRRHHGDKPKREV